MNWFERYGIVGAYSLLILLVWVVSCTSFTLVINTATSEYCKVTLGSIPAEYIGGFFTFTFLPVGYIVSMFSMMFYYSFFGGRQIHREIANILKLDPNWGEWRCEAVITAYDRLRLWNKNRKNPETELEGLKFLASFGTRRFDVLSINNSIILSTLLSPIIINVLIYFRLLDPTSDGNLKDRYFWLSAYTVILVAGLMRLNLFIGNQIIEINRQIFNIDEADALRREKSQLRDFFIRIIIVICIMWYSFSIFAIISEIK